MQKARRSSIQSTKTYKAFQAFQPQDLTQAFQFYKDIPDIPVIHDIPTLQALLHVPAPSSTIQYLPVLSSVSSAIQCTQGFYPFQHFFNQNTNSTHRLVSTRNSIEYQSKTIHYYKLSFFKEREMLRYRSNIDIFSRIEFNSSNVLSSRVTNYKNDIHKFS